MLQKMAPVDEAPPIEYFWICPCQVQYHGKYEWFSTNLLLWVHNLRAINLTVTQYVDPSQLRKESSRILFHSFSFINYVTGHRSLFSSLAMTRFTCKLIPSLSEILMMKWPSIRQRCRWTAEIFLALNDKVTTIKIQLFCSCQES